VGAVVIVLDEGEARQIVWTLEVARRALRVDGLRLPAAAEALISASDRQRPPDVDAHDDRGDGVPMPLLVDLPNAAVQLGLGLRTTERLVADRRLRSVRVGGRRMIARVDIEAFVDELRAEEVDDRQPPRPVVLPAVLHGGSRLDVPTDGLDHGARR
jgi:excisionase family DNA binding protein